MSANPVKFNLSCDHKPKAALGLELEGTLLKESLKSRVPINPLVRELDKTLAGKGFSEGTIISSYKKALVNQDRALANDLKQTAQQVFKEKAEARQVIPISAGLTADPKFYLSIKPLGEGNNHTVSLAIIRSGEFVAASTSKKQRVNDEVKYHKALEGCPNVIQLVHEEGFCCFFELAQCNLLQMLAQSSPERDLFPIMLGILDGGVQMAERGVIHLDLKPDNILISKDGVPKIADFELALFADPQTGYAIEKLKLGNILYYSPERRAKTALPFLFQDPISVQDNVWGFMHLLCHIALKQSGAFSLRLSLKFAQRFCLYSRNKTLEIEKTTLKSEKKKAPGYYTTFHRLMYQFLIKEWKDNLFAGLTPETPLDFIVMKMAMFDPLERLNIKEARDLMLLAKNTPQVFMPLMRNEKMIAIEKQLKSIEKKKEDLEKAMEQLQFSLSLIEKTSQDADSAETIRRGIKELEKKYHKLLQKEERRLAEKEL